MVVPRAVTASNSVSFSSLPPCNAAEVGPKELEPVHVPVRRFASSPDLTPTPSLTLPGNQNRAPDQLRAVRTLTASFPVQTANYLRFRPTRRRHRSGSRAENSPSPVFPARYTQGVWISTCASSASLHRNTTGSSHPWMERSER